jgi:hypothetical protein
MKNENTVSVVLKMMVGALFIMAGRVDATPYSFSVDQAMLLGNVPGFAVDEFDDGVLAPWWVDHPTVIESGGFATLSNPGDFDSTQVGGYLFTEEESELRLSDNLGVIDGAGDFTTISKWLPAVPEQNQMFGMSIHIVDSSFHMDLSSIDIGILNIGPLMADALDLSEGLAIFFNEDSTELNIHLFPIIAEEITDNLLFSLYFDDSADMFSGEFSLDGGLTYQSPFAPIYTPMDGAVFDGWELYANSYDVAPVPEPSAYLLMLTGLVGLGFVGKSKINGIMC